MINWTELFALQKKFDTRIIIEKGLEGTDTLPWRTVAFLVELSEFANEARFFKMWSNDREPRRGRIRGKHGELIVTGTDLLLMEFVDALHFLIGIGLELDFTTINVSDDEISEAAAADMGANDPNQLFLGISRSMTILSGIYALDEKEAREEWIFAFILLLVFGRMFGITDEEIVQAFKAKDAENHARQDRGY